MLKDEYSYGQRQQVYNEVKIMSSLEHENIIRLIGIVQVGKKAV